MHYTANLEINSTTDFHCQIQSQGDLVTAVSLAVPVADTGTSPGCSRTGRRPDAGKQWIRYNRSGGPPEQTRPTARPRKIPGARVRGHRARRISHSAANRNLAGLPAAALPIRREPGHRAALRAHGRERGPPSRDLPRPGEISTYDGSFARRRSRALLSGRIAR